MRHLRLLSILAVLCLLGPRVMSQAGVYAPGCDGPIAAPQLSFQGSVSPGGKALVELTGGLPFATAVLVVGTDDTANIDLSSFDGVPPGCALKTNAVLVLQLNLDATGGLQLWYDQPSYLGDLLCFQFVTLGSTQLPLQLVLSEALRVPLELQLHADVEAHDFGPQVYGQPAEPPLVVTLSNDGATPFTLQAATLQGSHPADFSVTPLGAPLPVLVPGGDSLQLQVDFTPAGYGPRTATLLLDHLESFPFVDDPVVVLAGIGLGEPGSDLLLDCGGTAPYVDGLGQTWAADWGSPSGTTLVSSDPVAGTAEQGLYQSYRRAALIRYTLSIPNGEYEVTLHFVEPVKTGANQRRIDVVSQGQLVIDDLDLFAVAGHDVAHTESFPATITNGLLDLRLSGTLDQALVSAIEMRRQFARLEPSVAAHDFSGVAQGGLAELPFMLTNTGNVGAQLDAVAADVSAGDGSAFALEIDGTPYSFSPGGGSLPADHTLPPGASLPAVARFSPPVAGSHAAQLVLSGNFDDATLALAGTGGGPDHPWLWAQAAPVADAVDWDGTGVEVILDGSASATYEPGHTLVAHTWTAGVDTVASGALTSAVFDVGAHVVTLTIEDDHEPPESDSDTVAFTIHPTDAVPGVSARYTDTGATPPAALLDAPPAEAAFAEVLSAFHVPAGDTVGGSALTTNVLVRLTGAVTVTSAGLYELAALGGADQRLLVGGSPYAGPVALGAGSHLVEARFAVDSPADLPLQVLLGVDGGPLLPLDPATLSHDAAATPPVLASLPSQGFRSGGEVVALQGSGFFPASAVTVHWGPLALQGGALLSVDPGQITLLTPPMEAGPIDVAVETPAGTSNTKVFTYGQLAATPAAPQLVFGATRTGETSGPLALALENLSPGPVTIADAIVFDADASDFGASFRDPLPIVLEPGGEALLDVTFAPGLVGPRTALLQIVHDDLLPQADDPLVTLTGIGLGPPGEDILLDAGNPGLYVDATFTFWAADYGSSGGQISTSDDPVAGTDEPSLYQSARSGPAFSYALQLPDGVYDLTLHFCETVATVPGERVMDVVAEGQLLLDDLDLLAVAGHDVAHTETLAVTVEDGMLDLQFTGVAGDAQLAALEARLQFAALALSPASHDFGEVAINQQAQVALVLENAGTAALDLTGIDVTVQLGAGHDIVLTIDGVDYQGGHEDVSLPADHQIAPGASLPATLTFDVTEHGPLDVDLVFSGNFEPVTLDVTGIGLIGSDPFLHVVIEPVPTAVDYDQDGVEPVLLDGSFSHTHEPGQELVAWDWTLGQTLLATSDVATVELPLGTHEVCLTITDDDEPSSSLTDCVEVKVVPPTAVPGVAASYFHTGGTPPASLLDAPPLSPDWQEALPDFFVDDGATVGGSPYASNVLVVLAGEVQLAAGDWVFAATGGVDQRLYVDGTPALGAPLTLAGGSHLLEARFAVGALADLPLSVLAAPDGSPPAPLDPGDVSHDETADPPFINSMPSEGSTLGGNLITITGTGFFPAGSVVVNWGATPLSLPDFDSLSATQIVFTSPPHSAGTISVTVQTPQGGSNARPFTYTEDGPPPIAFTLKTISGFHPNLPTCAAWGPDGKLYVGCRSGRLAVVTVDGNGNYNQASKVLHDGVLSLPNKEILGIAFNPFDPPSPVKVYVAHSQLFAADGEPPAGPFPYTGQVSVLTGPTFDDPVPLITGLPASNHDHGVNGMLFDNNGDLLISIGSNTNAGIAHTLMGDVPEGPLTAAIVKAETSRPDFDGTVTYVHSVSGLPSTDQMEGELVDLAPGGHVQVHAPGIRNCFDFTLTTDGRLYATDNGPNGGYGNGSSGPDSDKGNAAAADELLLVEHGVYYGMANRSRARHDPRQYEWWTPAAPSIPGVFQQCLGVFSSSINGIDEYRATTFASQMRGNLVIQRWKGFARRVVLSADGRSIVSSEDLLPRTDSLGLLTGPGGAILGVKYQGYQVDALVPQDAGALGVTAYDIFPWRAPATGGAKFVIGGANFGTLGNTSVTIGGLPAQLTLVSGKRIEGLVPAQPSPTTELLDVVVTSGPEQSTITDAFRYLFVPAGNEPGRWETGVPASAALGEVAGGIINGKLYLVGEGGPQTLTYDITARTWSSVAAAQRPFKGHHHAAEVFGGRLYLVGGLDGGSEGKVQIYDPASNLWTAGAPMPWPGGSVNTALIGDKIYVAGGISGGAFTTDECAVYDPLADSWTLLSPMVDGRNHASAGTDGERLWVFGGRGPGSGDTNMVANGFADVQVYDPVSDTWESSNDPGSLLAPLPIGRGGTGKAVFYQGEFYVMGGETLNGPGATPDKVYKRVDVYDPESNTWRTEAELPTARHGIFPLLYQSRMFVAGGGIKSGNSKTVIMEVFTRQ